MPLRLPAVLHDQPDSADRAADLLACYYAKPPHEKHGRYAGARFDQWHTQATANDPDVFSADDLIAVSQLAVHVDPWAAQVLLLDDAARFTELLRDLGPDRDLVTEANPWSDDWAGWQLWSALTALPGVGPTTASKLLARKRPKLRPIYDVHVAAALGTQRVWPDLREALQAYDWLHQHLLDLRDRVGLPAEVSALRVLDVVVWMDAWGGKSCPVRAATASAATSHR